ncbi:MAG: NAD(P)H-dependent oxidoreductase [Rhizobiaceae bacterium]|nr:NAD(P)H-dependent oxidoreductase [Rhizobiaceae bacterium]
MKTILCLSGSLREASSSTAVVETICREIAGEVEIVRFDISTLPHYNADLGQPEPVVSFKAAVEAADGLIIVTPEYNYSVPGVLKNAIDWASRPAYESVMKEKPVFVASVSGGAMGGVRAQSHLKYMLNGMLARVFISKEVIIPFAPKKVENGLLVDEDIRAFMMTEVRAFIGSLESA